MLPPVRYGVAASGATVGSRDSGYTCNNSEVDAGGIIASCT
jgi:hypothetical protein